MINENSDELDEDGSVSTFSKKVGKKKHFPFGTPSHLHHPYSQFAHLKGTTKIFAEDLAKATGVEAQILEDAAQPRRRRIPPKAQTADGEEDESVNAADEIPDLEGELPCTRLPCQTVLRQMVELQQKNQIEKLEIEDEYERLLEELRHNEAEIVTAEKNLEKVNEVGNALESKVNGLHQKVEILEKTRDSLASERTDINNKLMTMELDRQKQTRKLEQANKALSDARWRKKKADIAKNIEDGVTLATSVISEYAIHHSKQKDIDDAHSIASTPYNRLARGMVVDYIERPATVKIVPPHLVDKIIKNKYYGAVGNKEPLSKCVIDKYQKRHYDNLIEGAKQSWEQQEGTLIAENAQFYKNNNPALFQPVSNTGPVAIPGGSIAPGGIPSGMSMSGSVGSLGSTTTCFVRNADWTHGDDMRTVVFGPPKTANVLNTQNISNAAIRVGNFLQTRTELRDSVPVSSMTTSPSRGRSRMGGSSLSGDSRSLLTRSTTAFRPRSVSPPMFDCTNTSLKLNKSLNTLVPIHKTQHCSNSPTRSRLGASSKQRRLQPLDGNNSNSNSSSNRASPAHGMGNISSSMSLMSAMTPNELQSQMGHQQRTQNGLKSGRVKRGGQDNSKDVIRDGFEASFSDSVSLSESLFQHHSSLDPAFYRDSARTAFGRKNRVGQIRVLDTGAPPPNIGVGGLHKQDSMADFQVESDQHQNSLQRKNSIKRKESLLKQKRDGLQSRALTTKHHGMEIFTDSLTLR